jgi:hypothetical protein
VRAFLPCIALVCLGGCSDPGTCVIPPGDFPDGNYIPIEKAHYELIPGAKDLALAINRSTQVATVVFTKAGVRYRARYALKPAPVRKQGAYPTAVLLFKSEAQGKSNCRQAEASGPIIDAVKLVRDGRAIATIKKTEWVKTVMDPSHQRCAKEDDVKLIMGQPDGKGATIGNQKLLVVFGLGAQPRPAREMKSMCSPAEDPHT